MSKRASETVAYNRRKRKKNGTSASSSFLVPVDAPPSQPKKLMQVWHTNVEDPCAVRRSAVPISSEHRGQGDIAAEGEHAEAEGEDFGATKPAFLSASGRPKRPRRKRGNDSVSRSPSFSDGLYC